MGNSVPKDSVIPSWECSLLKGYNCNYYMMSSDPSLFQRRSCVVLDHDDNRRHYTLRDNELGLEYEDVPSVFISSSRVNYTWGTYFKVDTVVKTNATTVHRTGKFVNRARITDITMDSESSSITVDLVDIKTGFRSYCVTPNQFSLDKGYYKIK
mgnify:CR=1 FL=1